MANTVFVRTAITAKDVGSYKRNAVGTVDIPNVTPLECGGLSTDPRKKFVFEVEVPTAPIKGAWLAGSPESTLTSDEFADYANMQADPRIFINKAGETFDMFKPVAGVDLIQVTAPFFADGFSPADIAGATYVEMDIDGTMKAVVTPTPNFEFLQFKIIDDRPIVIGFERVPAWTLECTVN